MTRDRKLLYLDLPLLAAAVFFAAFSASPAVMAVFDILVAIFAFIGAYLTHRILSRFMDDLFLGEYEEFDMDEVTYIVFDPEAEAIEVDQSVPGVITLTRHYLSG